jgi:ATP-dependent Lhr-like helicase
MTDTTYCAAGAHRRAGLPWTVAKRTAMRRHETDARPAKARPRCWSRPDRSPLLLTYPGDRGALLAGLRGADRGRVARTAWQQAWRVARIDPCAHPRLAPSAVTWGLSATLGNLDEARVVASPA